MFHLAEIYYSRPLRDICTPDAISGQLEAMMELHKARLNTEVYREEHQRLKSELEFIESQFEHIKKQYERARDAYKNLQQQLSDSVKSGTECVNALPKDPNNLEAGNWQCVKRHANDPYPKPPVELIQGPWKQIANDIPTIDALIETYANDVEVGRQFYDDNQDIGQRLEAKKKKCGRFFELI